MTQFQVVSDFQPMGDQPQALAKLAAGIDEGMPHQVLLGVTGSGKTYTMAKVVEAIQKPTLVIAHNKTLAAQLYSEFREFLPNNMVEYFVSYYDYYQPEAYIPRSDTYIEKDAQVNEEIERLRLAATSALFSRRDVVIVASVSCIYGLGSPQDYGQVALHLTVGEMVRRNQVLRHLVDIFYERNDTALQRAKFRVRGDVLEVQPAYSDNALRVSFWGDEIERISEIDTLTGEILDDYPEVEIFRPSTSSRIRTRSRMRSLISKKSSSRQVALLESQGSCWRPSALASGPATTSRCCRRSATATA